MTNGSDSAIAFSLPSGEVPLGIQSPLLPSTPLGQSMLQPKFLTPLGARSLAVLDSSIFSSEALTQSDSPLPFQDSPFFDPPEFSAPEPSSQTNQQSKPTGQSPAGVSPQTAGTTSQVIQPKSQTLSPNLTRDSIQLESVLSASKFISESVSTFAPESISQPPPGSISESTSELIAESPPELSTNAEPPVVVETNSVPATIDRSELTIAPSTSISPATPDPKQISHPIVQSSLETAIAPTSAPATSSIRSTLEPSKTTGEPSIESIRDPKITPTNLIAQPDAENIPITSPIATESVSALDSTVRLDSALDAWTETVAPQHEASLTQLTGSETATPKREVSTPSSAQSIESIPDLSLAPLEDQSESVASSQSLEDNDPDSSQIQPILSDETQLPAIQARETALTTPQATIPQVLTNSENEKPREAIAVQPLSNQEHSSDRLQMKTNEADGDLDLAIQDHDQLDQSYDSQIEVCSERQASAIQAPEVNRSETQHTLESSRSEAQRNPEFGNDLKNQAETNSKVQPNTLDKKTVTNRLTSEANALINLKASDLEFLEHQQHQPEKAQNDSNLSIISGITEAPEEPETETRSQPFTNLLAQDEQVEQTAINARSTIQPEIENLSTTADVRAQVESLEPVIQSNRQQGTETPFIADDPLTQREPESERDIITPLNQIDSAQNANQSRIQPVTEDRFMAIDTQFNYSEVAIQANQSGSFLETEKQQISTEKTIQPQPESHIGVPDTLVKSEQTEESNQRDESTAQDSLSLFQDAENEPKEIQSNIENQSASTAKISPFNHSEESVLATQSETNLDAANQPSTSSNVIQLKAVKQNVRPVLDLESEDQTIAPDTLLQNNQTEEMNPSNQRNESTESVPAVTLPEVPENELPEIQSPIQSKLENQTSIPNAPIKLEQSEAIIQPDVQLKYQSTVQPRDQSELQLDIQPEPEANVAEASEPDAETAAIASAHLPLEKTFGSGTENAPMSLPEILPVLPTVIQRLSVWEPLVQLHPISSAIIPFTDRAQTQHRDRSPDQPVARKPRSTEVMSSATMAPSPSRLSDREPVTDWSSIAELLQASAESRPERQPDTPSGITSESTQADGYADLNLYSGSNSIPLDIIQREVEDPTTPTLPAAPAVSIETTNPDQTPSSQQSHPQASPEQLEQLAQEVYRFVRQRLALERERFGNLYSGRLL